jgi:ATP-dependent Clp protease adaptor protein ClpS
MAMSLNHRSINQASLEPAVKQFAICEHRAVSSTTAPERLDSPREDEAGDLDRPWLVIVWNDPINLMSYVTWVLQKLFGYPREKATRLMLQVHNEGRAVVASGSREKSELDCYKLHAHGLWATIVKSDG